MTLRLRLPVCALMLVLVLAGCGKRDLLAAKSHPEHEITNVFWGCLRRLVRGLRNHRALALPRLVAPRATVPSSRWRRRARRHVRRAGMGLHFRSRCSQHCSSGRISSSRSRPRFAPGWTAMTVQVIGHQWWWRAPLPGDEGRHRQRASHPGADAGAGRGADRRRHPQLLVPRLNRTIDMIPRPDERGRALCRTPPAATAASASSSAGCSTPTCR